MELWIRGSHLNNWIIHGISVITLLINKDCFRLYKIHELELVNGNLHGGWMLDARSTDKERSKQTHIYSFGMIMWSLSVGVRPYYDTRIVRSLINVWFSDQDQTRWVAAICDDPEPSDV
ncbi:hypothetical protein RhiirC2_853635 [Rhizophagus irregularis]|uniref:Protein kinase domain-containing protein n=1 Tax=Rhizophagus irregularis TaxID=588596 RepID=A0A2N1MUR0_9GLOM|nr:hypothetical protein RhiirC2_853635 [Rhizophagus irregularis]